MIKSKQTYPSSLYSSSFMQKPIFSFCSRLLLYLLIQISYLPFSFLNIELWIALSFLHSPQKVLPSMSCNIDYIFISLFSLILVTNISSNSLLSVENLFEDVRIMQRINMNMICLDFEEEGCRSIQFINISYNIIMSSSSQSEQLEQISPTSPPTNVVSVLTKMLECNLPQNIVQEGDSTNMKRKFCFYLDFSLDNQILKCEIQIEQDSKIELGLTRALQIFKITLQKHNYTFDPKVENFTLRLAKKNGRPKTDMPSIDTKQKFIDLKITSASIQIKNFQCLKSQPEVVNKTSSHYSVKSEIQFSTQAKKEEVLTDEAIIGKQKSDSCIFSFC